VPDATVKGRHGGTCKVSVYGPVGQATLARLSPPGGVDAIVSVALALIGDGSGASDPGSWLPEWVWLRGSTFGPAAP
jgi:hypothetical protein